MHFDRVLEQEQIVLNDALRRVTGLRELEVAAAQLGPAQQHLRQASVAQRLQLGDRQLPVRGAGVAGDEHGIAGLRPGEVDRQMVRRAGRPTVLVGA